VLVLLVILSFGVQDITFGPTLPGFVFPAVLDGSGSTHPPAP